MTCWHLLSVVAVVIFTMLVVVALRGSQPLVLVKPNQRCTEETFMDATAHHTIHTVECKATP